MSTDGFLTTALSVNVNKVALLRNSRHLAIPSVVRAAQLCLEAGAHGITVHPRPDERHIRPHDVFDLAALLQAWPEREYNIEGNPFHNLLDVAREVRARGGPLHQLTFVPDSAGQFTSDHGWDLAHDAQRLRPVIEQAHALGARVSLFMDAQPEPMAAARALGADRVEFYTEPYAAAYAQALQAQPQASEQHPLLREQLRALAEAAQAASAVGLEVNAGHDLNQSNLTLLLQTAPQVREVSIGHALVADALELGYRSTVQAYLRCIAAARPTP